MPAESGPVDRVTITGADTAQAGSQAAQAGVDAAGSATTGAAGTGGLSAGDAEDSTAAPIAQARTTGADIVDARAADRAAQAQARAG